MRCELTSIAAAVTAMKGLHVTEELDGELEEQESEDRGESSVALFAAIAKARAAINKAEGRP
jgi:hypothetical protein